MHSHRRFTLLLSWLLTSLLCTFSTLLKAEPDTELLEPADIFNLEMVADLQISPDGKQVFFVRQYMDIQNDRRLGNIWSVNSKNKQLLPLTSGQYNDYSPRLSPDGKRMAFISTRSGSAQIHMLWLASGHMAQLSRLTSAPGNLSWSPDGKTLAFSMFMQDKATNPVHLAGKPEGAKWAKPAVFIDDVYYRYDGSGYTSKGSRELFVLPADGGSPRQLTHDSFDNGGQLSWSPDSKILYFAANRHKEHEMTVLNTDIYALHIDNRQLTQLTDRQGPDKAPQVSPDGKYIAYLGYDDELVNYQNTQLYVMDIDGKNHRKVTKKLDRSIDSFTWASNSKSLYLQYDDQGISKLVRQSLRNGSKRELISDKLGGLSYSRPYTGAEFTVSKNNVLAFTHSHTQRPASIALYSQGKTRQLTALNQDALGHKSLARIEEIRYPSTADQREIHGWIAYPPNFDKNKKYPLILEIHGGPVTAYGPHFSMEVQLFAAKGYVVLYTNPRGSSSYGREFANLIDKNYPSNDYHDLMSGVDALLDKGFIDEKRLYITGGSGGGVLTAWAIGHTNRFAAAVVAKPVVNWYSFVLTADFYPYFYKYWFGKKPWEDSERYMALSPISYVGNVTTPTMLLTGEADYRTPISETEQYYQALKLLGVESSMVRIPDAPHGIYRRPSNLMSKVEYILWWFEKHTEEKNTSNK